VTAEQYSNAAFIELLQRFRNDDGNLDYDAWSQSPPDLLALEQQVRLLAKISPDSHPEQFADRSAVRSYWVNTYNTLVIHAVLEYWPLDSVRDVRVSFSSHIIPGKGFFYDRPVVVGGEKTNLYDLEKQILSEGADTIAAMIMEPITGASGVIVPPEGYYEKLQALLRKHDILVWADEVITGFGRTGNDFGSTTMGIQPDLMTFAKQLSSAYFPISAAAIPGWMYEAMIEPSNQVGVFGHGYTYSGHPAACAAALKTLEIYERDKLFEHAATVGDHMQARLREMFTYHPLVGEVCGKGLIAALELVSNKTTGASFDGGIAGATAQKACQDHGLVLRAVAGNSVALCPPLIITEAEVDDMLSRLSAALDATHEQLAAQGLLAG